MRRSRTLRVAVEAAAETLPYAAEDVAVDISAADSGCLGGNLGQGN